MKIKIRNANYCDGCEQLTDLHTLAGHKRCKVYKKNMLPQEDVFISNRGIGLFPRLESCKKENEAIVVSRSF